MVQAKFLQLMGDEEAVVRVAHHDGVFRTLMALQSLAGFLQHAGIGCQRPELLGVGLP